MNWLFIAVWFFVIVFFLLPWSLSFFCRENPARFFSIIRSGLAPWISSPSWNASAQLVKLCTPQCMWLLKHLFFAEVGDLTFSSNKNMNCYRATVVCLDAKGLWKPGQSYILAGSTLFLSCSALCRTEQTTIDIGCNPALSCNCVDHPADCNLFKNYNLVTSQ